MASTVSKLLTLSSLLSIALSATLRIQIPSSNHLPNPNSLTASTHAILTTGNSPPIRTSLRQGNFFEFIDIPTTGSHLLSIYSTTHTFAPYRVDIAPSNSTDSPTTLVTAVYETYPGSAWSLTGPALLATPSASAVVNAKCLSQKSFYEERQGFSPLSLLKNPMILMGVVALAFTFGMPKLMENMDPEMKAEYEEMQRKSPVSGITQAIQGQQGGGSVLENFNLAGWMAGQQTKSSGPSTKASGTDANANSIRERRR